MRTRSEQRAETRLGILDATVDALIEDGYALATTRRIAERAGIAQSTVMHHFPRRDALLVEAITHLARRMTEEALASLDVEQLQSPEAVLDQAWRAFTSPPALAAAQMWAAAWAEPELAETLRTVEARLSDLIVASTRELFGDVELAQIDATVTLIRGLVMAIPIVGRDEVEERWVAVKPLLLSLAPVPR